MKNDNNKQNIVNEVSKVAEREKEILAFWEKNHIFEKSLELNKGEDHPEFVFYDGPPFATGTPHYGHILASIIKDVIPRYKTMKGFHVPRKWGWDCHGLPVENLIEKKLGLASKKDIEDLGVGKFNKAARDSVLEFAHIWREMVPRFGRFVDMDNDYRTMDSTYTESVWWIFKTLHEKGLIYEGFKSMHICPHCETTLSNFEVNQGYRDITDISVFVKFELKAGGEKNDTQKTYVLAWTTTPWTLPGNTALAVGAEVDYLKVKVSEEEGKENPAGASASSLAYYLIFAKERFDFVKSKIKASFEVISEFKGRELIGKSYVPVFDYYANDKELKNRENGWKIYGADFVTTEDGTGVVHIAPAFGTDDYNLSVKEKIPFVQHVGMDGKFKKEVTEFAGQSVKPKNGDGEKDAHQRADIEIIKNMAPRGVLFAKEKLVHSYPHCWRCETPLLNYATSSWFVEVTKIKDKMVAENNKVKWVPASMGEGRFGKWLEGARDWAISRSRYWGAPLPVWKSEDGEILVAGSVSDLLKKMKPRNRFIVMRHGESEANVKNIHNGNASDIYHLTEQGKKEAEDSARKLKKEGGVDMIFSSPITRTQETAKIVADVLGVKEIITENKITELNLGIYDNRPVDEFYKAFPDFSTRFKVAPEGGENLTDVERRMFAFLDEIDRKYEGKTILIVTHECLAWLAVTGSMGLCNKDSLDYWDKNRKKDGMFNFADYKEINYVPLPRNEKFDIDLHRPFIDDVKLISSKGLPMKRVPEVFDCWFESGAMPYAKSHYLGVKNSEFNPEKGLLHKQKNFPADFIAEGQDQTRGWFYSMLVLGVALFGESPYKNVIVNGLVQAADGQKMSKSKKNYPDPMEVINKYGMDAVRYYMLSSPVVAAEDLCFTEKGVDESLKKNINRFDNVISFYEMYSGEGENVLASEALNSKNVLDKWILVRLAETISLVGENLDGYLLDKAVRPIASFVEDVSVWYLRRSRDRFKSDNEEDRRSALATTKYVVMQFSKVMAPFMPFFAEASFLRVKEESSEESVHLASWPEVDKLSELDLKLIADMNTVRKIVTIGLEARMKANVKVRQPLNSIIAKVDMLTAEMIELIKDELNVKEVLNGEVDGVVLDSVITKDLQEEGVMRELVRGIQEMRKTAGLHPSDIVDLYLNAGDYAKDLAVIIKKFEAYIKKTAGIAEVKFETTEQMKELDLGEMKASAWVVKR